MDDTKIIADRMIQRLQSFPSLPTIVNRVLTVAADPNTSVSDLKKIIEADSALAVEVLKLANSPFFGLRRKVASLEHGITLLGIIEIKNLILAKSMFQTFRNLTGIHTARLWQHSFYTGLAAKIIASSLSQDPNECFVAGLIHDIGKVMIYNEIDYHRILLLEELAPNPLLLTEEKKSIGISHDHLGHMLLSKWMFPERLVNAVGYHHSPQDANRYQAYALAVFLANLLSHLYTKPHPNPAHSILKNTFFNPAITQLADQFNLSLTEPLLDLFLTQLDEAIKNEAEVISLLEGGSQL